MPLKMCATGAILLKVLYIAIWLPQCEKANMKAEM